MQDAEERSTSGTNQAAELARLLQGTSATSQDEDAEMQPSPEVCPVAETNTTLS